MTSESIFQSFTLTGAACNLLQCFAAVGWVKKGHQTCRKGMLELFPREPFEIGVAFLCHNYLHAFTFGTARTRCCFGKNFRWSKAENVVFTVSAYCFC